MCVHVHNAPCARYVLHYVSVLSAHVCVCVCVFSVRPSLAACPWMRPRLTRGAPAAPTAAARGMLTHGRAVRLLHPNWLASLQPRGNVACWEGDEQGGVSNLPGGPPPLPGVVDTRQVEHPPLAPFQPRNACLLCLKWRGVLPPQGGAPDLPGAARPPLPPLPPSACSQKELCPDGAAAPGK